MTTANSSTSAPTNAVKRNNTDCSQRTKGTMKDVNFTWTIENVSFKCRNMKYGKVLESNIFSSNGDKVNQWQLACYPGGHKKKDGGFLSIFTRLLNPQMEVTAYMEWSVLNVFDGTFGDIQNSSFNYSKTQSSRGCASFLSHKDLLATNSKYINEDVLTLQCKITYELEESQCRAKVPLLETPDCRITNHIEHLFESGRVSDITFLVGRQQFKAHKIVMIARSSVFAGMFEIDGRVSPLASLKIEDCEPELFKAMLRFIYTDQMEETEEMAKKLLAVAQKYQLQLLEYKCEEVLMKSISKTNCAEMLLLADVNGATLLKKYAMDFFRRNSGDVIKTAGWRTLRQNRPLLGVETLEFIVS